jgi:hypothetical protein
MMNTSDDLALTYWLEGINPCKSVVHLVSMVEKLSRMNK